MNPSCSAQCCIYEDGIYTLKLESPAAIAKLKPVHTPGYKDYQCWTS